jgi:Leucine-rich repeat (LRR) protein
MNYCTLERLYNGTTTCYDEEFLTATTAERILNNQSTEDLEKISSNLSTIKSTFSSKYSYTCEGSSTFSIEGDVYKIAGKFAATTADEVSAYVTIPMLKILNIKRNLVESIDGIEELNELQELYVGDNELVSVDSVDWSKLTDLKILDLSYNDLSEIKCLEVISSLEDLDLSKNLIKGAYNFGISGMKKLQKLNLSYNAIDDISLLEVQLAGVARDAGYSDVAEYLEAGEFDIEFYGQVLTMKN